MASCDKCGRVRKPKTPAFKAWKDYADGQVKHFCPRCWKGGVGGRRHGFTLRSSLFGPAPTKISKLRAITISKYEKQRRKELKEQIGQCERCGSQEALSVHHYRHKKDKGLDEEDNYIVLCKGCHDSYHVIGEHETTG